MPDKPEKKKVFQGGYDGTNVVKKGYDGNSIVDIREGYDGTNVAQVRSQSVAPSDQSTGTQAKTTTPSKKTDSSSS